MSLLSRVLYRNPVTDSSTDLATPAWAQWFAALVLRVGGPEAPTNNELDFATQLDIREADDAEERKDREAAALLAGLGDSQPQAPADLLALETWWAAQDSALAALRQRFEALSLDVAAADALLAQIRAGLADTQVLAVESFFSTAQAQPPATGASTSPPPNVDNASVIGTTTRYAREDHTHGAAATVTPLPLAATGVLGTAIRFAREDHAHGDAATVAPPNIGAAGVIGTAIRFAREDHSHGAAATVAPGTVADASAVGGAVKFAREDHTHQGVNLDGAQTITGAKTFNTNVAAAAGVTIDGVDISVHQAGDAKAQHAGGVGTHTHQSAGAEGGTLAHGLALTGLANDDHTQYLPVSGSRAMTGALDLGGQNLNNIGANSIEVRSGTAAPSAGAGVAATIGSFYGRDNAGTGELWVKTGAADTAWTQVTIP